MAAEAQRATSSREQQDFAAIRAAAEVRSTAINAAVETISDFKINDCYPLGGATIDVAHTLLVEAHAVTLVLSAGIELTVDPGTNDTPIRPAHIARAIDAIGTMIALAVMASEARAS